MTFGNSSVPSSRSEREKKARFEKLVRAFSADLYRYGFWLCQDKSTAEDLVQETFTRAWRAFGTLRDETAAKGWLISILRREHARLFERERPKPAEFDLDATPANDWGGAITAEALTMRRALGRLPRAYREPIVLQVLGGYSAAEIAATMGISPAAVMTRLHRARQRLRRAVEEDRMLQQPGSENEPASCGAGPHPMHITA